MLEELVAQPHCIYVYGCNKICLNASYVPVRRLVNYNGQSG